MREVVLSRTQIVKEAMVKARGATPISWSTSIYDASKKGGLFVTSINLYPTLLAEAAHLMLPVGASGRDEPHVDERRAPHAPVARSSWTRRAPRSPIA